MEVISKNKIKKAGKILADKDAHSKQEILNSESILQYWRILHEQIMTEFYDIVLKEAKDIDTFATVAQRVKRSESIIAKLQRQPVNQLTTMQDIAGIRAIMPDLNTAQSLRERLKGIGEEHKFKTYDNYITNPKDSGYRSIHLVYKYVSPLSVPLNGLMIEIQIRTELQHSWATAVETMSTFLGTHLKFGEGQPKWLKYFALTSSSFSYLENTPQVPGYEHMSEEETYEMALYEFRYNEIEEKLSAFTTAANHITKQNSPNKFYHLITLNTSIRRVNIKSFQKNEFTLANQNYTDSERKYRNTPSVQVVLVSTESIQELRKAFPNYFLDVAAFLENMSKISICLNKLKERRIFREMNENSKLDKRTKFK